MSDELLNDQTSVLDLTDEEILAMEEPETSSADAEEDAKSSEAESDAGESKTEDPIAETNEDTTDDDSVEETDSTPTEDVFSGGEETVPEEDSEETAPEKEDTSEVVESKDDTNSNDGIDYKSEYNKIMAPFKANGKMMNMESADEAVQLMQMGANYAQKMSALKPNLKLMKMLENNSLLDEAKLSFLIDLDKKNPDAIQKLIKDSGIDPLDVDTSDKTTYQPNTYTVHDKEIELDSVLEEIQDTPSYSKTIDVVSNKWDAESRKIIVENPQVIRVINEHMSNGIYDQIMTVMDKERALGRLTGSDIESYRRIGDQIYANGGFANQSPQQPTVQATESTPKPKKQPDPKVKSRKKAAAPTKSAPTKSSTPENFNPLSLSDEEFEKLVSSKYT